MLKSILLLKKKKLHGLITRKFLGLRMWNVQGIVFIWTLTYRHIFKSAYSSTEYKKIRTRNNSLFGHFSRSVPFDGLKDEIKLMILYTINPLKPGGNKKVTHT